MKPCLVELVKPPMKFHFMKKEKYHKTVTLSWALFSSHKPFMQNCPTSFTHTHSLTLTHTHTHTRVHSQCSLVAGQPYVIQRASTPRGVRGSARMLTAGTAGAFCRPPGEARPRGRGSPPSGRGWTKVWTRSGPALLKHPLWSFWHIPWEVSVLLCHVGNFKWFEMLLHTWLHCCFIRSPIYALNGLVVRSIQCKVVLFVFELVC